MGKHKKQTIEEAAKEACKHQNDEKMTEKSMEVAKVSFSFTFTRDEAEAYIKKPKGQIARNIRKYMCRIFEVAAEKMLATPENENIKNCKLNIDEGLK